MMYVTSLQAEEMIADIKQAFKKNLANITWMDEETKQAALDKVNYFIHFHTSR